MSSVSSSKDLYIFSSQTGKLICENKECGSSTNSQAAKMYRIIQKVQQFFSENFQVHGIDGRGRFAPIYIEWDQDNASWACGSKIQGTSVSCTFQFHNRYIEPEIVAHEYTHAIISTLAPLTYAGQPGALDESLADVFGIAFKQWATQKDPDWQIADRNLAEHPAPFKPSRSFTRANDFGFVHENSKIPSHAFCIAVSLSAKKLGQKAIDQISQIWFASLRNLQSNETFQSFAKKTLREAEALPPRIRTICYRAIAAAWAHVEIKP
jgi:Zn-dependent metalloprotease